MKQPKYYICSARLKCSEKDKNKVLSALLAKNIAFYNVEQTEDGIEFSLCGFDVKDPVIDRCCETVDKGGMLPYIASKKDRVGILIGVITCIVSLYIASMFVWDIKIEPIEGMENDEVEQILLESGLYQGAYIPSLDMEKIQLNVLMKTDKLSYITVNVKGSVATVQGQRRQEKAEVFDTDKSPCNIVAGEDGQIVRFQTEQGMVCRGVGDVVRKGELLISGMYEDEKLGMRSVHAKGKVYAEVNRHIEVDFPCTVYEKTYTGNCSEGIAVSVFGKKINIYGGEEYGSCDERVEKENVNILGVKLPVVIHRTRRTEFTYEKKVYSEQEIYDRAMEEFEEKLSEICADGELVQKDTSISSDQSGCRIVCNVTLIADIAEISTINLQ